MKGSNVNEVAGGGSGEFEYQLTMSLVRQLRKNGIVLDDEYGWIDMLMLSKYRPPLGALLAGVALE